MSGRVCLLFCLLSTGDHDDRVCPLHSYKYAAELQHTIGSRPGEKPLLIRIDMDCGHGGGKPTVKVHHDTVQYGYGNKGYTVALYILQLFCFFVSCTILFYFLFARRAGDGARHVVVTGFTWACCR